MSALYDPLSPEWLRQLKAVEILRCVWIHKQCPPPRTKIELTSCFIPDSIGCLLPNAIQPSLGQTLLLYAAPAVYDTYRKLADEAEVKEIAG